MRQLLIIALGLMSANSLFAAERYAARFTDRSSIEIQDSAGMLDLNSDYTIEVWAKWRRSERMECIAGDEAWPEMSPDVKVAEECGWTLRKMRVKGRDVLDFNIATDRSWMSLQWPLPKNQENTWVHIAVCRHEKLVSLYVDGRKQASTNLKGRQCIKSPTPLYLGVRPHAHVDRKFDGFIRGFRMSKVARYTASYQPAESFESDDETLVLYDFVDESKDGLQDRSGHRRNGLLDKAELVPLTR